MNTEAKSIQMTAECVERIAQGIFQAQPLMKKRLAKLSAIQSEQGIPLSHVQVLAMLEEGGSMSVSEISKRFGIAKPNITPLVDRLVNAGLVDRVRSESDRRVVNIVLLPAGEEKLAAIRATISRQIQVQSGGLSVSEFRELNESLSSVVRILASL